MVTAQYRTETVQDIPLSGSVLMGGSLQKQGISGLEDVTGTVPNLTIEKSALTNVISIRGVSSGLNQGFEQSVGMFLDGIYMGRGHQMRIPFLDVGRVEVLRGSQSVLFGQNTIAGAISMHTRRPDFRWEGRVEANYQPPENRSSVEAASSVPVSDTLALRLAYRGTQSDGFMFNRIDEVDTPSADEQSGRFSLLWQPSGRFQAFFKLQASNFDTEGRNWEVVVAPSSEAREVYGEDDHDWRHSISNNGGFFAGTDIAFEFSDNNHRNASLQLDYDTEAGTLTSITGLSLYDYHEVHDADYSPQAWVAGDEREDFEQLSQELRFVSSTGERFDYIAGAYWQTSELDYDESILVPYFAEVDVAGALAGTTTPLPPGTAAYANESSQITQYTREVETASAFGQLSWHLTRALTATAGIRYLSSLIEASQTIYIAELFGRERYDPRGVDTPGGDTPPIGIGPEGADVTLFVWDQVNVEPHRFDGVSRRENNVTGGLNIQYEWSDDLMTYLRFDRGIKDGGFDPRSVSASREKFEFEEEKASTLEFGIKSTLLDGAAEVNIAAFHSVFEDRQVSVFNGGLSFEVSNAGESKASGVELDSRWQLTRGLLLTVSAGYIDSVWESYRRAACAPAYKGGPKDNGDGTCDLSGDSTYATPEEAAYVALDYETALSDNLYLRARLSADYRGETFVNPGNDPLLIRDPVTMVDLRLALAGAADDWEVGILGSNLTDEYVMQVGTVIPLSEDIAGGLGANVATVNPPRTYTLQARYRF